MIDLHAIKRLKLPLPFTFLPPCSSASVLLSLAFPAPSVAPDAPHG